MTKYLLLLIALLIGYISSAQEVKRPAAEKMYKVNYKWELPVPILFFAGSSLGFKRLDEVARMSESQVLALDPKSINAFDRPGAFYDPSKFKQSQQMSDMLLNVSVASPVLLLIDKRIRKDWADFLGVFLMAHMIDNVFYFSGAFGVRRPRPLTYNPGLDIADKTGVGKSNAFFSGHTSWSATSTFLIAKIYTDYHDIKGWKRIGLYTAAAVPPGMVGFYRMRAGKHFRSDVITGLLVGAACGIGVPELHRQARKQNHFSFAPFSVYGASGLTISYQVD